MQYIVFNINTDASQALVRKMQEMNRSAFPVAVRQTLNQAAFDVKQNSLETSATRNFIRRTPNFFKRFSGVNRATGFNVETMQAEVGMTDMNQVTAQAAILNMDVQESGGSIKTGADYLKDARAGSNSKKVTKANYFNKSKLVKGSFKRKGTAKSQFIASAFIAAREKKFLSMNTAHGRFLMKVSSVRKSGKGNIKINSKLIIKDRNAKPVAIKATHFSREAAMLTYARLPQFFNEQANKQFAKVLA